MGRVNAGGSNLDTAFYNFPLSIGDAYPTPEDIGHIFIKSSTLAPKITNLRILETLNAGEANGTLMFVVGDLVFQNGTLSQPKQLVSGGNYMTLSIANDTGVPPEKGWLVSHNVGSMTNTLYLNKPMVYSKVDGVLDIETSYMWDGVKWVTLNEKGNYLLHVTIPYNGNTINKISIYNRTQDNLVYPPNTISNISLYSIQGSSSTADGRYLLVGGIVYKRVGDVYQTYMTIPATRNVNGYNATFESGRITKNGNRIVTIFTYLASGTYQKYICSYIDTGATFAEEFTSLIGSDGNINNIQFDCTSSGDVVIIIYSYAQNPIVSFMDQSGYSIGIAIPRGSSYVMPMFSPDETYLIREYFTYNSTTGYSEERIFKHPLNRITKTIGASENLYLRTSYTSGGYYYMCPYVIHPDGYLIIRYDYYGGTMVFDLNSKTFKGTKLDNQGDIFYNIPRSSYKSSLSADGKRLVIADGASNKTIKIYNLVVGDTPSITLLSTLTQTYTFNTSSISFIPSS